MLTTRRCDQGPSMFSDSENIVFDNSEFNAATTMYKPSVNVAVSFHAPTPKLDHSPDAGIDPKGGLSGSPNPRTLLDQRPLRAGSSPKGLMNRVSGLLDGWTNRLKGVPTQSSSPYDSDSTPALTPGSSCASSPFSSQEDVRLSSMVEFEPPHLGSQNPTTPLVYYRNMLTANKGLPIFRPRPSNPNFGDRGTSLGDVGTYSPEEGFNMIFNIWDNKSELKSIASDLQMTNLTLPSRNQKVHANDIPRNSTIHQGASSHIIPAGSDAGKVSSFDFRCQSDTGAVLVATSPADREELDNRARIELRDWILAYPELIYRLANSICPLGDEEPLYIVSGCIKSESWAIAAFLERGAPPYDLMRLQNMAYDGGRPSFLWTEKWSTTDATFGASEEAGLKDQTLFVTGYTLDFSPAFRGRVKRTPLPFTQASPVGGPPNRFGLSGDAARPGVTDRFQQEGQEGGRPPVSEAPRFNQFSMGGGTSAGGSQDGRFDPGQRSAGQWSRHSGHHGVTVNFFPGPVSSPEFCHPSSLITKQLLAVTGKEVALCHDDEWKHALERLDAPDFAQEIIECYDIKTDSGVANLGSTARRAEGHTRGPASTSSSGYPGLLGSTRGCDFEDITTHNGVVGRGSTALAGDYTGGPSSRHAERFDTTFWAPFGGTTTDSGLGSTALPEDPTGSSSRGVLVMDELVSTVAKLKKDVGPMRPGEEGPYTFREPSSEAFRTLEAEPSKGTLMPKQGEGDEPLDDAEETALKERIARLLESAKRAGERLEHYNLSARDFGEIKEKYRGQSAM